jgi:hypothetical protein
LDLSQTSTKRSVSKTLLAWIFAILFVISAIGVIFSFFPIGNLLNPEFYQQAMVEVNIYQRLPDAIANQLAVNLNPAAGDSDAGISLVVLNDQEWEAILIDLIDPDWLQTQSEGVIDQVFELLLVSEDPLNTPIEFSVSDIKESIAGPEGVQAINQIINAQPPCSLDQLVGLVQVGLGMENTVGSILCRPPDFILAEINPLVESFLMASMEQVPETIQFQIPFAHIESQSNEISQVEDQGFIPESLQRLRQVNTLRSWSPLLPIFFLLLMSLVAVRSLRDFMAWWGGTLFTAGALSLIFSSILVPALTWAIKTYLPMDLVGAVNLPEILVNIGLTDLYSALVNQLQMSIIIPAGMMAGFGFALLLGLLLLSRISPKINPQPDNSQVLHRPG